MHCDIEGQINQLKAYFIMQFFLELITLTSWGIWNSTNDFIFKGIQPNLYAFQRNLFLVLDTFVMASAEICMPAHGAQR